MELFILITKIFIVAFTAILIASIIAWITLEQHERTVKNIVWYQIGESNKRRGIK